MVIKNGKSEMVVFRPVKWNNTQYSFKDVGSYFACFELFCWFCHSQYSVCYLYHTNPPVVQAVLDIVKVLYSSGYHQIRLSSLIVQA